jgi:nitroimidazol reductase NimA-like FMN-containing flavoprotein (pyridoxamine 5'-phosphate oxidase superfamily)
LLLQLSSLGLLQLQDPQMLPVNFAFLWKSILIPSPIKASTSKKSDKSNILKKIAILI